VASASAQGSAAADRERSPDVRAGRCGNGIAIPASTQKAAPADALVDRTFGSIEVEIEGVTVRIGYGADT